MLIIPANSASASGGFNVANSCRFNDGDSASMSRDQSANNAGTNTKGNLSVWLKMSAAGTEQVIYTRETNTSNYFKVWFENDKLLIQTVTSGSVAMKKETNRVFRDPSAWYNIVVILDSTDGTAGDRQQIWINGVRETSFASSTNIGSSSSFQINTGTGTDYIARRGSGNYYDGYMAELVWIDGTDYAATLFGEFDEDSGIWKPIDVSGLTFGTNGFYLDFKDSSAFGNDVSGNNNDFTVVGLAAADQSVDTCTNNQCVLNSILLPNSQPATFSQGNTQIAQNGNWRSYAGTFGLTSGKWYFEADGSGTAGTVLYGIASLEAIQLQNSGSSNLNYTIGLNKPAYAYHGSSGGMYHSTSSANAQGQGGGSWGAAFNSSNLISVYIDLDNNKLYTAKDNTMNVSGTGYDIEAGFTYFPVVIGYAVTTALNFGNGDFNGTAVSSAVADANGFGKFEFDPSRGGGSDFDGAAKDFLCINSKNLSTVNS